jgi:hypothetical protein
VSLKTQIDSIDIHQDDNNNAVAQSGFSSSHHTNAGVGLCTQEVIRELAEVMYTYI